MTPKEKIDYMIQSLRLAKEEIEYAEAYLEEKEKCGDPFDWIDGNRKPNGTIIRESLRQVGRMANIIANDVALSQYCDRLFGRL